MAKGARAKAPMPTLRSEPTKTGMTSVTILETGVAEPKRIMPEARQAKASASELSAVFCSVMDAKRP